MPERIKEGHAMFEYKTIPRIVGGIDQRSAEAAAAVFSVFPAQIHIFDNPSITETAKLFCNIYRDVNISLVNELAQVCERLGVDIINVIMAANTDPKTHLLTPGPGVGGYCLPKDTFYLSAPAIKVGIKPRLIMLARKINEEMPQYVLSLVDSAFQEMKTPIKGCNISVLGLSFKGNTGDMRNTPAVPIILGLLDLGAHVLAHDPLANIHEVKERFPQLNITRNVKEAVQNSRCVVIVSDHLEYRNLDVGEIAEAMTKPAALVDTRHIIDPDDVKKRGLVYRGVGRP